MVASNQRRDGEVGVGGDWWRSLNPGRPRAANERAPLRVGPIPPSTRARLIGSTHKQQPMGGRHSSNSLSFRLWPRISTRGCHFLAPFHGLSDSMAFHGISCHFMSFHGIEWPFFGPARVEIQANPDGNGEKVIESGYNEGGNEYK